MLQDLVIIVGVGFGSGALLYWVGRAYREMFGAIRTVGE